MAGIGCCADDHRQNSSQKIFRSRIQSSNQVTARLDGFVSWLWQVLVHVVSVASKCGELGQRALPRVEAVEQWKTVLRGRTDGRSGRWVGRAGHNHSEWVFSCPEPAGVASERSRRPDQRGVARRSTEVVVVRQLGIRLKPEVRHVWWELPSP